MGLSAVAPDGRAWLASLPESAVLLAFEAIPGGGSRLGRLRRPEHLPPYHSLMQQLAEVMKLLLG